MTSVSHSQRSSLLTIASMVLLLCLSISARAAEQTRILHHEPLALLGPDGTTLSVADPAANILEFDAFGQRFRLQVAVNRRGTRNPASSDYQLLRGRDTGRPGSWLRLTRRGADLSGLLSNGSTLYAIEPRSEAAGRLLHPDTDSSTTNIIYRLSDVILPAGVYSCVQAPTAPEQTADEAMDAVVEELQALAGDAPPVLQAQGASRHMMIEAVADFEFSSTWLADTEQQIDTRLNLVDGIFTSQIGVEVVVGGLTVYESSNDPFTASFAPDLLNEVGNFRLAQVSPTGPTHLFTGRNLDGTTRGIAWVGDACGSHYGAGLSQQLADPVMSSLSIAHELAHNLGAIHDGDGVCASMPQTFLMAPTITGSNQFSSCSVGSINQFLADTVKSSCLAYVGGPPAVAATTTGGGGGGGGGGGLSVVGVLLLTLLGYVRRRC